MGLIDQIEEANLNYARNFSDLYRKLSTGKELGETPGNPIFTDDVNLHRMPNVIDNIYTFLKVETSAHYKTMDSRFNVTNKLIGELIDVTYKAWGETSNFDVQNFISESNSNLQDSIKESTENFASELERYQKNQLKALQNVLDEEREKQEPTELDPKQYNNFSDKFDKISDSITKVGTVINSGLKTTLGSVTDKLLTYGTDYYDNEFTNKISDSIENFESKIGSGVNKLGQMTSGITSGLQNIANSLTGGLGNLMDLYTDPQVQQAFAKYGSRGMERASELYGERIDIMKELIRDYGYSENEAKRIATQEMTRTGTRDYTRLSYEQQLSDRQNEMDYQRSIRQRRAQEQRDWSQSALLSAVEIFKTPKQIATVSKQIYEMDRIMPGLNFQATEFYQTMISVFDDTGKMGKEMFEEIRDLSKNLMVDPQTLLAIGNTYTKYLKLMTKGGINFQKQMTNVIKVTAKLEDQFIDSQGVFGEINEIGFTMLSNMSDDLLTKTQLYARELGMSVTEFQQTARSAPAEAAELLLSAKRGYAERMGIDATGDIGEREMAILQQIGITGFESIMEFLEQGRADLSQPEKALAANQGTELGPLQRQIDLSNEAWERQLTLLDREYDRRMDAWQTEQKILHDWENTYYTDWEKRQLEMDKELLENTALDTWNDRLKTASRGLEDLGTVADATKDKLQVAGVAVVDGIGSFLGSFLGNIGGGITSKIGGKLFGGQKGGNNRQANIPGGNLPSPDVFDQDIGDTSSKGASVSWETIGKSFTVIAGGIALVAGSVYLLGQIDTSTMKQGAENTRLVGEAFSELYEPVGLVLGAAGALGLLVNKTPIKWKDLAEGLGIIEMGIAGVAVPIAAIGLSEEFGEKFDMEIFKSGAENAKYIGEGIRALYEPVGILLAASGALGALFVSTGGLAAGAMISGLAGVEAGIAGVAVPIEKLGKIDTRLFVKGKNNAQVIGDAMDSLYKPVSFTITSAMALGSIFTGTLGIGWISMKSGLNGMNESLLSISKMLQTFGKNIKGIDSSMIISASNAGLMLTKLVSAMPREDNFFKSFIFGKKLSTGALEENIKIIGKSVRNFQDVIGDGIDPSIIESAANASKTIFEIVKNMPRENKWLDNFVGTKIPVDELKTNIGAIAAATLEFQYQIEGIGDVSNLQGPADAAVSLVKALNNLPRENKWADAFVGKKLNVDQMVNGVETMGEMLKAFIESTSGITEENTSTLSVKIEALTSLIELVNKLPRKNVWKETFVGEQKSTKDLINDFENLGKGINSFYQETKDIIPDSTDSTIKLLSSITEIDFGKINDLDGDSIRQKLIDVADGIKAYNSIDFTTIEYSLSTKLNEFISSLDYETVGNNFRSHLAEALGGEYDGSFDMTINTKFSDFSSTGEIGENINTLVNLNNVRNTILQEIKDLFTISNKKINNFNWDTNKNFNNIASLLSNIKSQTVTNGSTLTTISKDIQTFSNNFSNQFSSTGTLYKLTNSLTLISDTFTKYIEEYEKGKSDAGIPGIYNGGGSSGLLKIAQSQVGATEGRNGYTKYGAYMGFPNDAWCASFVSWCANQAGISTDKLTKSAAANGIREGFIRSGNYEKSLAYGGSYIPSPGDVISFTGVGGNKNFSHHVGIVESVVDGIVHTIEGNSRDMVRRNKYKLGDPYIIGYGKMNGNGNYINPAQQFINTLLDRMSGKEEVAKLNLSGDKAEFINQMKPYATVAANLLQTTPGTLLAQWAHESAWGTSNFARNRNNFAGINAVDRDPGRATYYDSPLDFAKEYAKFIGVNPDGSHRNTRYMRSGIFGKSGFDYYSILKQNGYATDPNYVSKLISIYNNLGVHKTGLSQVPYDNYPALLHKNERVLNASEAQLWNNLQESKMGNYEPSIQEVTVQVDTDTIVDSISTLTDVVTEIYEILKPKTSPSVNQTIRPKSNLITQYV